MRCARASVVFERAVLRAVEWVEDEIARLRYEGAAGGRGARVSTHATVAGAVGAAAIVADVAAGPIAGPVAHVAVEAAICALATDAVRRVARRRGLGAAQSRSVLAAAIDHAERERLCAPYTAEAWRFVCRIEGVAGDERRRAAAKSMARTGAGAVVIAATAKVALKKLPWVSTALQIRALPEAAFAGARLVAAVEGHAERACARDAARARLLRVIGGATPARVANQPFATAAA